MASLDLYPFFNRDRFKDLPKLWQFQNWIENHHSKLNLHQEKLNIIFFKGSPSLVVDRSDFHEEAFRIYRFIWSIVVIPPSDKALKILTLEDGVILTRSLIVISLPKIFFPILAILARPILGVKFIHRFFRKIPTAPLLRSAFSLSHDEKHNYLDWQRWLSSQLSLISVEALIDQMTFRPLISVVLPAYKSNLGDLRQAIDSLLAQHYKNWELCICDDGSGQAELTEFIKTYQEKGLPIKLTTLSKSGHISLATNNALTLAAGQAVSFMDHDDTLDPLALLLVAWKIDQCHNEYDFIFTDEDKLSERGGMRFFSTYKHAWQITRLESINYCSHLVTVKTELLNELGGLRQGVEGAQDWDLLLRICKHRSKRPIAFYIPWVAYHWRQSATSTAKGLETKNYAIPASKKALADYFDIDTDQISFDGVRYTRREPNKQT